MASLGIDNALARLRLELEGMQRQDKAIYSQLLTLRESIRDLKTELIREREEYEEAFRELEEISEKKFEDDEVFIEQTKTDPLEASKVWKHDRQDSGISVKTPEAETADVNLPTKHDFVNKPGIIPQSKQPLTPHATTNVVASGDVTTTKPIRHGRQDSGILIDEEAVRNTKLLSKLVESSELFQKIETRRFDQLVQSHGHQVREQPQVNRGSKHERSRSSTDLLLNQKHQRSTSSSDFLLNHNKQERSLRLQLSIPNLRARHSHSSSCPQTSFQAVVGSLRQFSSEDKSGVEERGKYFGRENEHTASSEPRFSFELNRRFDTPNLNSEARNEQQYGLAENLNAKDCARQMSFKSATNDSPVTAELTTKSAQLNLATQQEKAAPEKELQADKPMRAVVISAGEVNVSNTTKQRTNATSSRRFSLDERGPGHHGSNDVTAQRRFTINNFETDRMRKLNGEPRLLSPPVLYHPQRNHLRHKTKPEYDVMKRRQLLQTEHAPSKSWDGYARKPMELKRVARSVSQVSFV